MLKKPIIGGIAALAIGLTGAFAPTASAASDEYEAGYRDAHEGGLAYQMLAAGASAKPACRESTVASNVDFPEMDIDDFMQGCLDGMEAQGWR